FIEIRGKKIEINGSMSLEDIENITEVPSQYLISKLSLPQNVSKKRNIGFLKRMYRFNMQDVRKYIREYIKGYKLLDYEKVK
ncbi:hypothetical protein DRQ09_10780, partial [candidate division KSB1 bacterium]